MTATTEAQAFKKRLNFENESARASIDIEFTSEGRLSISGDVREFGRYGGASAGQCQDLMLELFPETKRLYEIWEAWHLNDMRAACEHQRASAGDDWNPSRTLEFTTYRLKYKNLQKQNELKERAIADAQMSRSEKSSFNKRERDILKAPYTLKVPTFEIPANINLYEFEKLEEVTAGWTRADEHPHGILGKPCETCGYKYGTSWLFEEVPSSIIDELKEMK